MLQLVLVVLLVVHGMIHFTGMMRTILPPHAPTFKTYLNQSLGIEWALAGVLFIVSGVLLGTDHDRWWIVASTALVFSQVLIFFNWHDARFGTVANVILAIAVYFGAMIRDFQARYTSADDHTGAYTLALPDQHSSGEELIALSLVRLRGDGEAIPNGVKAHFPYCGTFTTRHSAAQAMKHCDA